MEKKLEIKSPFELLDSHENEGIDWTKEDMYEGIGRPDLKPKDIDLEEAISEDIEPRISQELWNDMLDWKDNVISNEMLKESIEKEVE